MFRAFIFLFGVMLPSCLSAQLIEESETQISVKGIFQGRNLFLQNPNNVEGFGFCVKDVFVNGEEICQSTSGFEIDFYCHNLAIGDSVTVMIKHAKGCKPKVLNPEVLRPKSTFRIVEIEVDTIGVLHRSTLFETGKLPFIVEQYRWKKWVKIGEVSGVGTPDTANYSCNIQQHLHSGTNMLRLVQVDFTNKKRPSELCSVETEKVEVGIENEEVVDTLKFNDFSDFEIYDAYGNIVRIGYSNQVDCSSFKKGRYYINVGQKTQKFEKK